MLLSRLIKRLLPRFEKIKRQNEAAKQAVKSRYEAEARTRRF
jgi:hypothetical protein